jgi:hypothetical protein
MRKSYYDGGPDALHRDGFHFHSTCPYLLCVLEYAHILMNETKKIHGYSLSYSLVPESGHLLNNSGETRALLGIYKDSPKCLPKLG